MNDLKEAIRSAEIALECHSHVGKYTEKWYVASHLLALVESGGLKIMIDRLKTTGEDHITDPGKMVGCATGEDENGVDLDELKREVFKALGKPSFSYAILGHAIDHLAATGRIRGEKTWCCKIDIDSTVPPIRPKPAAPGERG